MSKAAWNLEKSKMEGFNAARFSYFSTSSRHLPLGMYRQGFRAPRTEGSGCSTWLSRTPMLNKNAPTCSSRKPSADARPALLSAKLVELAPSRGTVAEAASASGAGSLCEIAAGPADCCSGLERRGLARLGLAQPSSDRGIDQRIGNRLQARLTCRHDLTYT